MTTKENSSPLELSELTAISSVDGRYGPRTAELRNYLSEYALFKHRTIVEIEYFTALCDTLPELRDVPKECFPQLEAFVKNFSVSDAHHMKQLEKTTNHDVKAVEYALRELFDQVGLGKYKEFIHFGLTSYDINSVAVNMMVRGALNEILNDLEEMAMVLKGASDAWKDIPMLAHTHGQPASPTKLGKEMYVFFERIWSLYDQITLYKFKAKFGGATGNLNAHYVAYPHENWHSWSSEFLEDCFDLERQETTTQIEHYDNLAELFDLLKRVNTVFIDLSRDMWTYISMGYFNQKVKQGEVGSSAMPHKVNPIDFENAEGNAGIAIALFEHLSTKLPVSRLQRDLSGSTVERIIGLPLAHFMIAILSLQKAFKKVEPNIKKISNDLENNWAVIAEGIQTILRREFYPDPYKALKELTRIGENKLITKEVIHAWVDQLVGVSDEVKAELKAITPWNYTGK